MKIALLQTDIEWADPQENIRRVQALIDEKAGGRHGDIDLYVLPEMWATGFCTEPDGIAEDEEHSTALQWMKDTARQRNCAICGSLAVRTQDGRYRNRHYFVTPDSMTFYDKRHLFTPANEDKGYKRGTKAVVAEWKGMRLLLQTCYDLRFPVFSRYGRGALPSELPSLNPPDSLPQTEGQHYDAIIYVANWPHKRQDAWEVLTRARAIENQCYVIAVNRVGDDPHCHYAGGSVVIDPMGRTIGTMNDVQSTANLEPHTKVLMAEISVEMLRQMRQKFPVLEDRDRF